MPRSNPLAPAATGPIIRHVVGITTQAQQYEVILDYMAPAPMGVNTALLTAFLASWKANNEVQWQAILAADTTIDQYRDAEIAVGTTPTLVTLGVNKVGTGGPVSLNGMLAVIGTKYSGLKGQHGRGRSFFGPIDAANVVPATEPNKITPAALTTYQALATHLQVAVPAGGANWSLVISTRPLPPTHLVTNAVPVTSITIEPLIGTVRRRREGRGQ